MNKLLKKKRLIKYHKNWIKNLERMVVEVQDLSFQGYCFKQMERHEKVIRKMKRL